jgi:hypothetical protein
VTDDSVQADPEQDRMLAEALIKARRLVSGLLRQQRELRDAPAGALDPERLARGSQMIDNALASARRMLTALEEAIVIRIKADPHSALGSLSDLNTAAEDINHHDN